MQNFELEDSQKSFDNFEWSDKVKKTGSLIGILLVFIAGVMTGIGISAWKLDVAGVNPQKEKQSKESNPKDEIRNRIAAIERMLKANPDNIEALIQLGNDYFDIGEYPNSVEAYDKALQIDPGNAEVLTDKAVAYRRMGKSDESIELFQKALKIDPGQTIAMFNLGIVLRDDKKDLSGALKVWKDFLEKAPDSPHAVMIKPWVTQLEEKLATSGATTEMK
jgi:cytochrome c-type biogenesis protein CcmH/NrfG